ncbi:hypothetical protein WICMUC_001712 [Wickerhamomyces mucosus]|uniref:Uncharacterized protein n=1 Tax=Wickerhamomyces mucosus TaxID=1378264 RepID=A0A9P8PUP2_9ASCO|nr:hypothetical protein WICMUC_001712 [Wickerhamomyces mucosus]
MANDDLLNNGIISVRTSKQLSLGVVYLFDKIIELVLSKWRSDGLETIKRILWIDDINNIPFENLIHRLRDSGLDDYQLSFVTNQIHYSQCFDLKGVHEVVDELESINHVAQFEVIVIVNLKEIFEVSKNNSYKLCMNQFNNILLELRKSVAPANDDEHTKVVYLLDRFDEIDKEKWLLDYYIDRSVRL